MLFLPYRDYPYGWWNVIFDRKNSPLRQQRFALLKLKEGQSFADSTNGEEIVMVVLSGKLEVWVAKEKIGETAERNNVFHHRATAVYFPPGVTYSLKAFRDSEIAAFFALANRGTTPKIFFPDDIVVRVVGQDTFEREVHQIVGEAFPAEKLLVGETFNKPGKWSSYPPHRHERANWPQEMPFEEVYHYRIIPEEGFGVQCFYSLDRSFDEAFIVRQGSSFAIPFGFHPVVAAPGCTLYYVWSLSGEARTLRSFQDPNCGY